MPRMFTELPQGQAFSRDVSGGTAADTGERNFRVILNAPNESYSPQAVCGVFVGDAHPLNPNITCQGFDAKFDGESRLVNIISFKYGANASPNGSNDDPKQKAPDVRPPLWSTSTSLTEVPVIRWLRRDSASTSPAGSGWTTPVNPVNDRYEGISRLEPVTTISIEQYEPFDPTKNIEYVGNVNSSEIKLGTLTMPRRTVMLRGVTSKPHTEPFGPLVWRGWLVNYEFCFKRNKATYYSSAQNANVDLDIGWDITQIVEGFNITNDGLNVANVDQGALHYEMNDLGAIAPNWNERVLAAGGGGRWRANVKIQAPGSSGVSQRPSSSPVALNDDGTPRAPTASPPVLVYRHQIYEEVDFKTVLKLRF